MSEKFVTIYDEKKDVVVVGHGIVEIPLIISIRDITYLINKDFEAFRFFIDHDGKLHLKCFETYGEANEYDTTE